RLAVAAFVATSALAMAPRVVHADDVSALTDTLASSSASEKERISAVTALARLGDKRALRPLVSALHDPSAMVRAIAAAGLGKLGHGAALPARRGAQNDRDPLVQRRARTAVVQVCEPNGIALETQASTSTAEPAITRTAAPAARGATAHPAVYVVVKSSKDDSPGRSDDKTRKQNAIILRDALLGSLRSESRVTAAADDARRYGLDPCQIDLSITKLEQRSAGEYIEADAELRL